MRTNILSASVSKIEPINLLSSWKAAAKINKIPYFSPPSPLISSMLESNGHSVESYESYFPSNLVLHYCCIMEIFLNRLSLNFSFETVINRIVYASTHVRACGYACYSCKQRHVCVVDMPCLRNN